jgi:hypothetical protein
MSQLQFITPLINREWQIKRNDELRQQLHSIESEHQQNVSKFKKTMHCYQDQKEKAGESLAC